MCRQVSLTYRAARLSEPAFQILSSALSQANICPYGVFLTLHVVFIERMFWLHVTSTRLVL
jgi:hypothetical protein